MKHASKDSKRLWNIFHGYDVDGGFGDPVYKERLVATVLATPDEIEDFVSKWDKPRVYDEPYLELAEHNVWAKELKVVNDLNEVTPYDPDFTPFFKAVIKTPKGESYTWVHANWDITSFIKYKANANVSSVNQFLLNGEFISPMDYERTFEDFGVSDQELVAININTKIPVDLDNYREQDDSDDDPSGWDSGWDDDLDGEWEDVYGRGE